MKKLAYSNKYIYFSQNKNVHQVNSLRLNSFLYNETEQTYSDIFPETINNSFVFIASDILLLDNVIQNTESNFDCDIFTTNRDVDDIKAKQYFEDNTGISLTTCQPVGLIRISPSGLQKLLHGNKDSLSVNIISDNSSISKNTIIKDSAFSTKAKTLRFFEGLTTAKIDPGVIIQHGEWNHNKRECLKNVIDQKLKTVIVRSSSLNEDGFTCSNAGAFDSCLNIPGDNIKSLTKAIDSVFSSFQQTTQYDEVFIQSQITDPELSGVCTTRVIGKNSPYYVINYDDESCRTDSVTAGDTNSIKTIFVYRKCNILELNIKPSLKSLIFSIQSIENIIPDTALDIEFVISKNGDVNIVQIRPLVGNYDFKDDVEIDRMIDSTRMLYDEYSVTDDGINKGNKIVFGVMPDANPAELIGIKPKPLAFSLYQYLITDNIVTNQRYEYGYRDVRPYRHMIKLGGSPYINVRSSFNSFTPKDIDNKTVDKLINCYLRKISDDTSLHDKVEFDIVATSWFPGINQWFDDHYPNEFRPNEITAIVGSLKRIFTHSLKNTDQYNKDIKQYQHLFSQVIESDQSVLNKASSLIDICYHYGCKPFAHLARSGFIAISVLKGFLNSNIISKYQYDTYLQSIESVSSKMEADAYKVKTGKLSQQIFYDEYGHLRPGTYDINSEAYFENYEKYLKPIINSSQPSNKKSYFFEPSTISNINNYFKKEKLNIDFYDFDTFARSAISGREFGKFKYTRFLSYGLHYLLKWGETKGLSRNDLSYLSIFDVTGILSGNVSSNMESILKLICNRKFDYDIGTKIELPDIIKSSDDFIFFEKQAGKPNFITGGTVSGSLQTLLSDQEINSDQFKNKIVLINSADPGFDWLFGCSIAGLITKYGGANSHMAIRCAELNIPAAIGVGDILYNKLVSYGAIYLDCISETIREI